MKAKVTGVKERPSKWGGNFYHIFFKGEDGKSYLTHAFPVWAGKPVANFKRWNGIIKLWDDKMTLRGRELWLSNLNVKKKDKHIIDADSLFTPALI